MYLNNISKSYPLNQRSPEAEQSSGNRNVVPERRRQDPPTNPDPTLRVGLPQGGSGVKNGLAELCSGVK